MTPFEEEKERFIKLANTVYNTKRYIQEEYTLGLYGNKYIGIDDIHEKTLNILQQYEDLLDSILNLN